ncbi:hypothetical protein acsn021_27420 [Anaerocolumna cellulosilytica]|uniref:Uncharacterized protein n=1 Tax=Anaerocolumna cellulosilytica TaxID=433286 RepID=A0A6S6QV98_9FIRM|nr:GGDEF domain-containing protein [Anaerocolumna cellulosilytica]MBB5198032.1 diguanylate cyclase (GGDEF)-like protein [Anaerocolumna cellulosilytica]BCJ95173.1 hypothetical protein acsn021_27420 [Anaerocolumna cellulosilytica]
MNQKSITGINKKFDAFYSAIFQNSMTGQVVVDRQLNVLTANKQMFRYFDLELSEDFGSFGNVFRCAYKNSYVTECGKTEQCKQCNIRKTAKYIFKNRKSVQGTILEYAYIKEEKTETKWFQFNGILHSIDKTYAVLEFIDITEYVQQIMDLSYNLTLDLATGTLNKQNLIEAIQTLHAAGEVKSGFTICMIDFDNFKSINDVCGHLMGDTVLKTFSDISKKYIRANDILGRYGGEEFIIVFCDYEQEIAMNILAEIHRELEHFFAEQKLEVPVTFSAGAIYVDLEQMLYPDYMQLLEDVDKMLYRAKRLGKSRAMSSLGEIIFSDL